MSDLVGMMEQFGWWRALILFASWPVAAYGGRLAAGPAWGRRSLGWVLLVSAYVGAALATDRPGAALAAVGLAAVIGYSASDWDLPRLK